MVHQPTYTNASLHSGDSSQMYACQKCKHSANVIQRALAGGRKIRGPYCLHGDQFKVGNPAVLRILAVTNISSTLGFEPIADDRNTPRITLRFEPIADDRARIHIFCFQQSLVVSFPQSDTMVSV
ncbi:hypothetical protein FNV43_RR11375 [Rhamnella rubrinervis]|uniref:Uncharacterized protein n=1 Tax=Rhamnella rubrinervis TaxID=2594499 RepID=A0A8K0MHJ9_9ROSA|nr:hypothetical protein FNV43_RR11375 [Rhamnella rubrinervis]